MESKLNFLEKLFGNIEFVGELYRRKILPQSSLIMIFEQLLCIANDNQLDDMIVEAAINLMNKVGQKFEESCLREKKKAATSGNADKTEGFTRIMERFDELQKSKTDDVSTRIQLLIKNMYSNRESGW